MRCVMIQSPRWAQKCSRRRKANRKGHAKELQAATPEAAAKPKRQHKAIPQ